MPSGHTDRATINARRPLTPGMRDVLKRIAASDQGFPGHRLYPTEKSQARALADRGLVLPDAVGWWTATPAGRSALQQGGSE